MKSTIKFLTFLCFSLFVAMSFSACSSDDPADNDLFIGTYKGNISYLSIKNPESSVAPVEGKVVVTKASNTYSFHFDHKIPDLKGVKFEKKGDHTLVSIGSALKAITITKDKLEMRFVNKDGNTWTANCTR